MAIVAKRTVMTLYSDNQDAYSHQVRIVLAEKGVNFEVHEVTPEKMPQEFLEANPYGSIPTLVDRELVLYQAGLIMEYLDERFPHPPLLPVYPVARAEQRKMMHRIEEDWYSLMRIIENGTDKEAAVARKELTESLTAAAPVFGHKTYFLSDDFSLMDCCIAPLLWRLPELGIELPKAAKAIQTYAKRVFERKSFQASLTDVERDLRAA